MYGDSSSELEQLIHQYAFENQQQLKLIEEKEKLNDTVLKDHEAKQKEIEHLKVEISKLDETTKYYHQQFILNRDNCQSLKRTGYVLSEQEHAMHKKLEVLIERGKTECEERARKLQNYRDVYKRYETTYKKFPLAQKLQACLEQQQKLKAESFSKKEAVDQKKKQLEMLQKRKELQACSLNEYILKLAKLKVSSHKTCEAMENVKKAKEQSHGTDRTLISNGSDQQSTAEEDVLDDSMDTDCSPFIYMFSERDDQCESGIKLRERHQSGGQAMETSESDGDRTTSSTNIPGQVDITADVSLSDITVDVSCSEMPQFCPPVSHSQMSRQNVVPASVPSPNISRPALLELVSASPQPVSTDNQKSASSVTEKQAEPFVSFRNTSKQNQSDATVSIHFQSSGIPSSSTPEKSTSNRSVNSSTLQLNTTSTSVPAVQSVSFPPPSSRFRNLQPVRFPFNAVRAAPIAPPIATPIAPPIAPPTLINFSRNNNNKQVNANPQAPSQMYQRFRVITPQLSTVSVSRPQRSPVKQGSNIPMVSIQKPKPARTDSTASYSIITSNMSSTASSTTGMPVISGYSRDIQRSTSSTSSLTSSVPITASRHGPRSSPLSSMSSPQVTHQSKVSSSPQVVVNSLQSQIRASTPSTTEKATSQLVSAMSSEKEKIQHAQINAPPASCMVDVTATAACGQAPAMFSSPSVVQSQVGQSMTVSSSPDRPADDQSMEVQQTDNGMVSNRQADQDKETYEEMGSPKTPGAQDQDRMDSDSGLLTDDSVVSLSPFNLKKHKEKLQAINTSPGYPLMAANRRMFESRQTEEAGKKQVGEMPPQTVGMCMGAGGDNLGSHKQTVGKIRDVSEREGHPLSSFLKDVGDVDQGKNRGLSIFGFEDNCSSAFNFNFNTSSQSPMTSKTSKEMETEGISSNTPNVDSPAFNFDFAMPGEQDKTGPIPDATGDNNKEPFAAMTMNFDPQTPSSTESGTKSLASLFSKDIDKEDEGGFFNFDFTGGGDQNKPVWSNDMPTDSSAGESGGFLFDFGQTSSSGGGGTYEDSLKLKYGTASPISDDQGPIDDGSDKFVSLW